jgi:uncharacterized protein (DUF433 family)
VSIQLKPDDRDYLERLATRRWKPTSRQKAQALLGLAKGETVETVSRRVGMTKDDLAALLARFAEQGLAGVGLSSRRGSKGPGRRQSRYATIEKTPGICGGAARVAGTRIPVWQLVEARTMGASEAQLLLDYPRLQALNLVEAWRYAEEHPDEIAAEIHRNAMA